jgi:hypothetical protein
MPRSTLTRPAAAPARPGEVARTGHVPALSGYSRLPGTTRIRRRPATPPCRDGTQAKVTSTRTIAPTAQTVKLTDPIGGPSGQAANLSRAGRSHSVMPTLSPGTATPQAPPVMPAPPVAYRLIRAHSARRVTQHPSWRIAMSTERRLMLPVFGACEVDLGPGEPGAAEVDLAAVEHSAGEADLAAGELDASEVNLATGEPGAGEADLAAGELCAWPSQRSWPACPAPRSAGLTSTSWSSPAGAATRGSLTARAAGRAGRSRVRPSRSAPRAGQAPPRRPGGRAQITPVMCPVDCWRRPSGKAPRSAGRRTVIRGSFATSAAREIRGSLNLQPLNLNIMTVCNGIYGQAHDITAGGLSRWLQPGRGTDGDGGFSGLLRAASIADGRTGWHSRKMARSQDVVPAAA